MDFRLLHCKSRRQKRKLFKFTKKVYRGITAYKSGFSQILKMMLKKRGSFCENCLLIDPVVVEQKGEIVAACIYIVAKNYPAVCQIGFFEAIEGVQDAVDLLVEEAYKISRERGIKKIIIGVNGHMSYGIGILANSYNNPPVFGGTYNPPYYLSYFTKYATEEFLLNCYQGKIKDSEIQLVKYQRIIQRVNRNFSFRTSDFTQLKNEIKIYSAISSKCFMDHPLYFPTTFEEDYELFKSLSLFINGECLIIAEKEGVPIGYILWYPDINELVPNGGTLGVATYIKNKLFPHRIKRIIIAEIAVLPEYQGGGVILALFHKAIQYVKNKYTDYESGWIFSSNFKSDHLATTFTKELCRQHKVLELIV
ncbi:GNAT family N-acetyltransferase [Ectobacillus sp. sgz5001026]|uniref:GNAT family N-acetyltransferase n=1 Tax=Ectobacillus sp. sgz5001026 TaxID=3242473 RepID=UPI0036D25196